MLTMSWAALMILEVWDCRKWKSEQRCEKMSDWIKLKCDTVRHPIVMAEVWWHPGMACGEVAAMLGWGHQR